MTLTLKARIKVLLYQKEREEAKVGWEEGGLEEGEGKEGLLGTTINICA